MIKCVKLIQVAAVGPSPGADEDLRAETNRLLDTHNGCCCDGLSAVWVDDVPRQSHNDTDPLLQFHGR